MDGISPTLRARLDELAEAGNAFCDTEEYEKALEVWQEALSLIPSPRQAYGESMWFEASVGYLYFVWEEYETALACFERAQGNLTGQGYGNPFVMLMMGETCLELGDEAAAEEYLLRAYMLDGAEVFEGQNPKYFDFLREHVDLGEDGIPEDAE